MRKNQKGDFVVVSAIATLSSVLLLLARHVMIRNYVRNNVPPAFYIFL